MNKEKYKVSQLIFEKCPVCKKGQVSQYQPIGFFSFLKSSLIACDRCGAAFMKQEVRDGEDTLTLDLSSSSQSNPYNKKTLKLSEWKRAKSDIDQIIEANSLPAKEIDGLHIVLKPGEITHWIAPTKYVQEKMISRYSGGTKSLLGGAIRFSDRTRESHGELRVLDEGDLILTNQRLIFSGKMKSVEFNLSKILGVKEYSDGVEISASNRQKTQIFILEDPQTWAAFINIAINKFQKHSRKRAAGA